MRENTVCEPITTQGCFSQSKLNNEPVFHQRVRQSKKQTFWQGHKEKSKSSSTASQQQDSMLAEQQGNALTFVAISVLTIPIAAMLFSLWSTQTSIIVILILTNLLTIAWSFYSSRKRMASNTLAISPQLNENDDKRKNLSPQWLVKPTAEQKQQQVRPFKIKYEFNEQKANEAQYEVICEDAIRWLQSQTFLDGYVVTSLPDHSEIKVPVGEWKQWFSNAVALILEKIPEGSCAIFYQTDCKILETIYDEQDAMNRSMCKEWIDKSRLCFLGAEKVPGVTILWHKVMLCAPTGSVKLGRPGYSHMICFGKGKYDNIGKRPLPDVIDRGDMIYPKAMGINACMLAMLFCKDAGAKKIIDPFCGKGSVMLAANYFGLDAVGVDISSSRCRNAKSMRSNSMKNFVKCVQTRSFMQV